MVYLIMYYVMQTSFWATGGEESRRHVATWTLLVTLDVPVEEPGLRDQLLRLRTGLPSYITPAVQTSWLHWFVAV